jgi:fucose 4-O-acetylase-like acetyltransferase
MGGALLVRYEQRLAEKRRALVALGLAAWVASVAYGIVISKLSGQTALTGMNAQFLFEPAILLGWWAALGHVAAGRLPAPLGKAVSNLGASTLGVYLAHYLFIRLYLFAGFSVDGVAHEIFFYIVVLCLSWLVANIGERVKGLRYLFTL